MYLLNSGGLESGFKLPSITFSSIQGYIWFIVSPAHHFQGYSIIAKIGNNLISTPFTYFNLRSNISIIGMIILLITLLIYSFLIKRTKHDSFINYGLLVLICTILIGVITSILIEPTFSDRHMFPALGCFYLTFSLLSKTYSKKQIFLPLFILFLLVSVSCNYSFICSEKQNELTIDQTKEVLNQVSANDMIIVTDDNFIKSYFVATIMGYHLPLKKPNIDEFVSGASNEEIGIMYTSCIFQINEKSPKEKSYQKIFGEGNKAIFFDKIKDTLIIKNKAWLFTKEEYDINNLNEIINKNGEKYNIEKVYIVPTSSTDLNYFDNVYLIH